MRKDLNTRLVIVVVAGCELRVHFAFAELTMYVLWTIGVNWSNQCTFFRNQGFGAELGARFPTLLEVSYAAWSVKKLYPCMENLQFNLVTTYNLLRFFFSLLQFRKIMTHSDKAVLTRLCKQLWSHVTILTQILRKKQRTVLRANVAWCLKPSLHPVLPNLLSRVCTWLCKQARFLFLPYYSGFAVKR